MKKLLSLILSVVMAVTMLAAFGQSANAAETSTMKIETIFVDGKDSETITTNSENPVISWKITKANDEQKQTAYSIAVLSSKADLMWDVEVTSEEQSAVYNGKPLVNGTTYQLGMSLIDEAGNKTEALVVNFKYEVVSKITSSDNLGNGKGNNNITMNGATIPAPTYTITIPEKIEFGNVSKKLKSTADAEAIAKTTNYTVTADYEYLFENQKNLTVTMNTDNKIVGGENEISFNLSKADGTALSNGADIFSIQPTAVEKKTVTQEFYATLDQRLIKASGDYTGTVTFTVALADNK